MKRLLILTIAAASGLAVSVGSFSAAGVLKEEDTASREIPWDGSHHLVLAAPAELRYVQTPGPGRVVVTGPRHALKSFHVAGGVLNDRALRTGARLKVVVHAPAVTSFSIKGRDRLVIENYDQETLAIHATGGSQIEASGRARSVKLGLQGGGWANLARLEAEGVEVDLTGARTAVVAPSAWARLSGNGSVVLVGDPSSVDNRLWGAGRLIRADAPG